MAVVVGMLLGGLLAVGLAKAVLRYADGAARGVLQIGVASFVCLALTLILLAVRGSHGWSTAFAGVWWSLFVGAVVSACISLGLIGRCRSAQRLAVIVLSAPALVAVPVFVVSIVEALGSAAD